MASTTQHLRCLLVSQSVSMTRRVMALIGALLMADVIFMVPGLLAETLE